MKRVVNFSGGICSYIAARRVIDKFGPKEVTLLFADVMMEDEDLYRFLEDAEKDLGVPITVIRDGRTPWEVFFDHRCMGNSRIDMCSRELKRELLDKWRTENCDPEETIVYIGLQRGEEVRFEKFKGIMNSKGWTVSAPAMWDPPLDKPSMLQILRNRAIEPPDLYAEGFPHNNCGGFCVKMGIKQARLLLLKRPKTYAFHERMEQAFIKFIGYEVSILKDRRGGETRPLTLKSLRERVEAGEFFQGDWGGCGCAID